MGSGLRYVDDPVKATELFDLRHDPRELQNRFFYDKIRVGYLLGLLGEARSRSARAAKAPKVRIDAEMEERLRALGYIR